MQRRGIGESATMGAGNEADFQASEQVPDLCPATYFGPTGATDVNLLERVLAD